MARLDEVLPTLDASGKARRDVWDTDTTAFVQDGELMQQANGAPYPYQLAWHEIIADDWQAVTPTSTSHHTQSSSL